jgi:hypothetical protein
VARVYATPEQLSAYTGRPAPGDADGLLARASRFLDTEVLKSCVYDVDADGMPTASDVAEGFAQAVCAQVAWWDEIGDSTGAAGAGWGAVSLGPLSLSRSVTDVSPYASAARQLAPAAWDVLSTLPPDLFVQGVVW